MWDTRVTLDARLAQWTITTREKLFHSQQVGEKLLMEAVLHYSSDMSYSLKYMRKMRASAKCQVGEMDCTTSSGKLIDRAAPVPAEPAGELSYLCFWPIGTAELEKWTSLLPVNTDITVWICWTLLHHINYFAPAAEAQYLWWLSDPQVASV